MGGSLTYLLPRKRRYHINPPAMVLWCRYVYISTILQVYMNTDKRKDVPLLPCVHAVVVRLVLLPYASALSSDLYL